MWGEGELSTSGQCQEMEMQVIHEYEEFSHGLEQARMKQERRSLRLEPKFFQMQVAGNSVSLNFELPPGAYATAVLHELMTIRDPGS